MDLGRPKYTRKISLLQKATSKINTYHKKLLTRRLQQSHIDQCRKRKVYIIALTKRNIVHLSKRIKRQNIGGTNGRTMVERKITEVTKINNQKTKQKS